MKQRRSKVEQSDLIASAASILGVKGNLRFRLHGSSQKAHLVLRRVELLEDDDEDSISRPTVGFSLFAQKRIEVKPGKEIFFSLPEGLGGEKLKDRPVIFEADVPGSTSSGEETEDEDIGKARGSATAIIPPRMRKSFGAGRGEQNVDSCGLPPGTFSH